MDVSMPSVSLRELSELVNGTIAGPADVMIANALPLQDARAGCLTLADSPKLAAKVEASAAAAVLVSKPLENCSKPMLVVDNLHAAFQTIILKLQPRRPLATVQIAPTAVVDPSTRLGEQVSLGEGVTIGADCVIGDRCVLHAGVHILPGCVLGNDCTIFPGVVLYEDTCLGNNVLLHANATIGAYGFGYRQQDGFHIRTAQLGWVELSDDVEIGAGTTIDRGTYGPTKIGRGTKIDNQVQIGHNCHIGEDNLICAQVGIAGSCSTGRHVVMAGQVGMADHLHLSDCVTIGAQAGVMHNLTQGSVVLGSPAIPAKQKMQEIALSSRLPEMRKDIKSLHRQIAALQEQLQQALGEQSRAEDQDAAGQSRAA